MNLSGNPIDYLYAFLGGIAVSFSPCVYPLIPVSAGYIGAKAAGSRLKGLTLSLVYVTGLAVTYSILGLLAALTGTFFGAISSHPVTYLLAGAAIIFFGLTLLEVIRVPWPNIIRSSAPKAGRGDYISVFLLGATSGLLVSPCLTPILGSILVYLAAKRSLAYGATLLFVFAYGMGLILILAGTFSSLLTNLPRSGRWMGYIKKACALILLVAGSYFVYSGIRRF
ncbi:cytochrome c biogenesis protein CcdA [Candidatus Omnitrophota bacterium]